MRVIKYYGFFTKKVDNLTVHFLKGGYNNNTTLLVDFSTDFTRIQKRCKKLNKQLVN